MLSGFISTLAFCAGMLTSCSSDSDLAGNGSSSIGENRLTAEAHSKEVENIGTRSALKYDAQKGMVFSWTTDDKLIVFAEENYWAKQTYSINPSQDGIYTRVANFSSADFKLTVDKRYYALSKDESNGGGPGTNIPDQKNITIDYDGQIQMGNASSTHLGRYDFMATSAVCEEEDMLHFDFQHLGATIRMIVMKKSADTYFPTIRFTELELYNSDNTLRQPLRRFDLSAGVQPDGSFAPAMAEPELTADSKRFTIALRDQDDPTQGILPTSDFNDGSGTNNYNDLVVYMEVPPVDLRTKTMGFVLHGKDSDGKDVTYYGKYNGINIAAGKAYNIYFYAERTTDYEVTLKVDHDWKYGNAVTRATGDPGFDKDFELPKAAYLFFCANGKVQQVNEYTGLDDSRWSTVNNISTFDTKTTLATKEDINPTTLRVYAIAAPSAITHGITTSSTEDDVKALTYTYSDQNQMRDLYSTPWADDDSFVGKLTDPMQDVFVYHTAAKVDLKWNNTATTPLSGSVAVNNFQSTNLSIFQPTQNGTGVFTSTTTQSISTAITPGTCWNGRQVYYLPQFANNQYNIQIGNSYNTLFEFTGTDTAGGFTSWLRAQIKQ